jgi:hypothetical protein
VGIVVEEDGVVVVGTIEGDMDVTGSWPALNGRGSEGVPEVVTMLVAAAGVVGVSVTVIEEAVVVGVVVVKADDTGVAGVSDTV